MSSQTLRILAALIAAAVAGLNQAFGWHLSAADVAGVVVPLVMLILADMHHESVEAAKERARLRQGIDQLLVDVLKNFGVAAATYVAQQQTAAAEPVAGPPTDTHGATAPTAK